jgi:Lon-like ATP-dependent protease
MENVPINQSVAMTGSLSVRGEVLPVGGVTSKVEAAISAGIKSVILPASNLDDVSISKDKMKGIKLIPVKTLADVLKNSLKDCKRKDEIIKELQSYERNPRQAREENPEPKPKPKSAPKIKKGKRPKKATKR